MPTMNEIIPPKLNHLNLDIFAEAGDAFGEVDNTEAGDIKEFEYVSKRLPANFSRNRVDTKKSIYYNGILFLSFKRSITFKCSFFPS